MDNRETNSDHEIQKKKDNLQIFIKRFDTCCKR